MNTSKTTLKKLLYEHNIEANALLRVKYRDLETAITKYLNFIENTPAIQSFLEEVLDKHMPENFNTSEKSKRLAPATQLLAHSLLITKVSQQLLTLF